MRPPLARASLIRTRSLLHPSTTQRRRNMSTSTPPPSRKRPLTPLILVLGATGTGKSSLALSLAHALNGEIINADAMQLYTGLPVITNKLSPSAQESIPHHLLDLIPLSRQPWTVRQFVRAADARVAEVRARGKVPVVVGGTHYYAHALVWRGRTLGVGEEREGSGEESGEDGDGDEGLGIEESMKRWPVLGASAEEMYEELKRLDPEMAAQWHPRDWRRVQRSLEICLRSGRKVSEIYREQAEAQAMAARGEGEKQDESIGEGQAEEADLLRYDPLVLWLAAEDAVLKERLNARVGDMVRDGLFEEALELQKKEKEFKSQGVEFDKTKGIWVSIGYKEMEPWAEEQLSNPQPLEIAKQTALAKDCLDAVRAGTRRYAKRQERYIRGSFAKSLKQVVLSHRLLLLDGTDLTRFYSHIVPQAEALARDFLAGRVLPDPSSLSDLARQTFDKVRGGSPQGPSRIRRHCEVCDRYLMTDKEWQTHITSNSHKKVLQGRRKHQQRLEYLQRAEQSGEGGAERAPQVDVPS